MPNKMPSKSPSHETAVSSTSVMAARLVWMMLGPLVLALIFMGIVKAGSGWATLLDLLWFAVVGLMIFCRWWEQRSGQATLATGEPATWEDFRHYVRFLAPIALGAWLAANLIGNHFLSDFG